MCQPSSVLVVRDATVKKKIPVLIKVTFQWEKQIIYKINKIST